MARMTGFVFQDEYLERLAKLSDQEVGRLVRSLAQYHATGNEPELTGRESVAFDFIKVDIDRADKSYQAKCQNMKRTNDSNCTQLPAIAPNCQQLTPNINNNNNKKKDIKETDLTVSKEKAATLDRAFDKFWAVYPRKEGKQDAKRAFLNIKLDDSLLDTMLSAIQRQKQTDQWSDPRYIPHPATWINGRRWEDEPQKPAQLKPGKVVSAAQYQQRDYDEEDLEARLGVNDLFRKGAS